MNLLASVSYLSSLLLLGSFPAQAQIATDTATASSANDQYAKPGAVKLPPRDEYTDTYRNTDGSFTAFISAKPIRRWTEEGWKDLDARMQSPDLPGYGAMVEGKITSRLGSNGRSWHTVTRNKRSVSFAFASASLSAGTAVRASAVEGTAISSQGVVYSQVFPGTDARLTTTPEGGLKEELVLGSRQSVPWNGEFTYNLALDGLDATPLTDERGSRVLFSESGTGSASPVLGISAPFAVDANGVRTDRCWYLLSEGRQTLTLVVDPNWLLEAGRAYPVTVDPTLQSQPGDGDDEGMDTYTRSAGSPDGGLDRLLIGDDGSSEGTGKAYIRFPLSHLPTGASISAATLYLHGLSSTGTPLVKGTIVDGPWEEQQIAPTPPSYSAQFGQLNMDKGVWTYAYSVTSQVQAWFDGTSRNFGVVFEKVSGTGGARIASRDHATASNRPLMEVGFTMPTPALTTEAYEAAGGPKAWEAGASLNPYQSVNLYNGNVVASLPLVSWQGLGPGIDFSVYHNSRQVAALSRGMGTNRWSHTYSDQLMVVSGASAPHTTMAHIAADGSYDQFAKGTTTSGLTSYTAPTGIYDVLEYHDNTYADTNDRNVYLLTTSDQMVYRYDTSGQLQSVADEHGQKVTLGYVSGKLTTVTEPNPNSGTTARTLTFHYDASNRLDQVTDPLGRYWVLDYDSAGDLYRIRLPKHADGSPSVQQEYTWRFKYGLTWDGSNYVSNHLITGIGEPQTNLSNPVAGGYNYLTEYNRHGQASASLGRGFRDYRGMHGIYVSYASGYSTVMDQTLVTRRATFSGGRKTSEYIVSNPTVAEGSWTAGPTTTYNWDTGTNNLLGVRLPGNPASITGMNPFWTTVNTYNSTGDVLTQTTYELNAAQSAVSQTRSSEYEYAHGHHRMTLKKVKVADGSPNLYDVTEYFYDGDTTQSGTSGWKQLTKTQSYASNDTASSTNWKITTYAPSVLADAPNFAPGRVKSKTDPEGGVWTYAYDGYGNLLSETSPGSTGQTVAYTYDTTAHLFPLTKTINGGGAGTGKVTTYAYHQGSANDDWWPTSTSANETFSPSGQDRKDEVKFTANGEPTYNSNQISSNGMRMERLFIDGGLARYEQQYTYANTLDQTVEYRFDAMGRRSKLLYPVKAGTGGTAYTAQVEDFYNDQGQLTSQKWSPGYQAYQTISYSYDSNGRLYQQVNPNNTRTTFTYNNLGEETERKHERNVSGTWSNLETYTTNRQVDGRTNQTVRVSSDTSYSRTTNVTYGTCSTCMGQVVEEQKLNGSGVQLTRQTYEYDKNGMRIDHAAYSGSGNTFVSHEALTYNDANQLTSIAHKNSSGVTVRTESFSVGSGMDASGNQTRPIGTVSGDSATALGYYPDGTLETTSNGGTLLSCYGGNGRLCLLDTRKFVYDGGQQILERASGGNTRRETVAGLAGDLVVDITDGGTITQKSVMYDPSGTLAVSVDGSGTIVRGGADVFGTNPSNSDEANYGAQGGLRNRTTPGIYQTEGGGAYDAGLGDDLQGQFLVQEKACDQYFQQCHSGGRLKPSKTPYEKLIDFFPPVVAKFPAKGNEENEYNRRAKEESQETGEDICSILKRWYDQTPKGKERNKINKALKVAGCKHHRED